MQSGVNSISTDVFVRLKATATTGTIAGSIQHAVEELTKTVTLSTTVAAPTVSVTPTSLAGFSALQNQPSLAKPYTFAATSVATGVNAVITAPAGYELSVQGSGVFSSALTLAQTSPGAISRVLLVRLKAQATTGSRAGSIANTVGGLAKGVAVSGVVNSVSGLSSQADLQSGVQTELRAHEDDSLASRGGRGALPAEGSEEG